ncbi:hypothetical protein [Botrimarina hoheduenensis]|uniref:Uncharacterized protein n=1 Tax=Botrimarina hoheduenensis TaxID=2528000 RepID=A0A5C5WE23_9BACT|nr:hypothetical protein [Botrimarina hoheduenensis]TWT48850.1 hypothetical protein Pla111_06260 [Botrimarina hoheduenensis]
MASLLDRRYALPLIPLVGIGAVVIVVAAWLGGVEATRMAVAGVLIAVGLHGAAEALAAALAWLTGGLGSLERMLFTMLVRATGAMMVVLIAIAGLGLEPKLVALIALPIYLSLIAGEAIGAMQLHPSQRLALQVVSREEAA